MIAADMDAWREANQRYLTAALALVRERLERHVRTSGKQGNNAGADDAGDVERALTEAERALPAPSALETLCARFGLSPFERQVLLLCAGVELDARFGALCAAAHGDARRNHATFGLALAALAEAHWSALTPVAPLRRWRLVELGGGESLTAGALRIDERVLHYLAGVSYLDDRLNGLIELVKSEDTPAPSHLAAAKRLAAIWPHGQGMGRWLMVQLCGRDNSAKLAIVTQAARLHGLQVLRLGAANIPPAAVERAALARLAERECALAQALLLIDCEPADAGGAQERAIIHFIDEMIGAVIVAAREPVKLGRTPSLRLDLVPPSMAERRELWRDALGPLAIGLNGALDALAGQFGLDGAGVRAAAMAANGFANGPPPAAALWQACREQARGQLDDLAGRIDTVARWDDLVMPEPQLQVLREIAVHVRRSAMVYETWGFATKGARGLGIAALFAGASGTGKTMAAEVLANELALDLCRIDLSQTVSKYIGETEKNLRRIFDAAEESGAILLFDEADALFGKRSEVKDSHDRHANIEVSYLLQRMEAYRGLAILTTNMKSALDPAFLRRIRFVVQFPFPDAAQRAEIWRRVFPKATPVDGLDAGRLSRLNVTGGSIRNIALNAAFLAADAGDPVRMAHLLRAARGEYAKLEKPLTDTETAGWA